MNSIEYSDYLAACMRRHEDAQRVRRDRGARQYLPMFGHELEGCCAVVIKATHGKCENTRPPCDQPGTELHLERLPAEAAQSIGPADLVLLCERHHALRHPALEEIHP